MSYSEQQEQIRRELAKLIKDKLGKGPEKIEVKVTTEMAVCILYKYLTKAEEMIVQTKHCESVYINRAVFILKSHDEINEIILKVLNKRIKHLFPSFVESDTACITIFLEQEGN